MRLNKFYNLIFALIFILSSCSYSNINNEIQGQWAIEELTINGKSYIDQMYSNVLIFKENNRISIPETFHFKKDKNATWKTNKGEDSITIKTYTTVFNDTFNVKFISRTGNDPLGIILKSDNIYIKANKLLDFYK